MIIPSYFPQKAIPDFVRYINRYAMYDNLIIYVGQCVYAVNVHISYLIPILNIL